MMYLDFIISEPAHNVCELINMKSTISEDYLEIVHCYLQKEDGSWRRYNGRIPALERGSWELAM
jgi:hypothetical protein